MRLSQSEFQEILKRPGLAKANGVNTPSSEYVVSKTKPALCGPSGPFNPQDWKGEVAQPKTTEERLNKTEKRFLALLRGRGYSHVGIQEITLRLGFDTRYTPDFSTMDASGKLTLWETKGGFTREDARVKIYTAAKQFPVFRFVLAVFDDGGWTETVIPQ